MAGCGEVSSRARNLGEDLHQFSGGSRDRDSPRICNALPDPRLRVVCAVMVFSGVSPLWPTGSQLILWGANEGARVILLHEYWRLFTSVFVHGGFIHMALDTVEPAGDRPLVERLYGNVAFAMIYLAAGIGGALSSLAANPVRASVGASGAMSGVLGDLLLSARASARDPVAGLETAACQCRRDMSCSLQ